MDKHLPPCVLVLLGAAGDLTKRLLLPAIYNLASVDALPNDFQILGVSQEQWSDEEMRSHVKDSLREFWGERPDGDKVDWIVARTFYQRTNLEDQSAYAALADRVQTLAREMPGGGACVLFYLALAPGLVEQAASGLAGAHLFDEERDRWRRLIIEKPFGHDVASAIELTEHLKRSIPEEQIFRIDHFAGKEAVHDIAVIRLSNMFLNALWNESVVDHVQITVAETVGVEQRASFYEKSGALRDMVPNHLAELLSIVAMERPKSSDPDDIRDAQVQLLRAVKPVSPEQAVRAQYAEGTIDGKAVKGYRQEKGVAPQSEVETYAAMRIEIDNDRWKGVPFYLRTGKCLAAAVTEIAVEFKQPTDTLLQTAPGAGPVRHSLIFRLQPDRGVTLEFSAKQAGMETRVVPALMNYQTPEGPFGKHGNGYERLLSDAIKGNKTLFQREDFVEAGWRMVEPLLDAWGRAGNGEAKLALYTAGSQGPGEADNLLTRDSHAWRLIARTATKPN